MYVLAKAAHRLFNTCIFDKCDIDSNDPADDSGSRLVLNNGGLATFYRVEGSFGIIGESHLETLVEDLTESLTSVMRKEGFTIQFVFTRDPSRSSEALSPSIQKMKKQAERLELDVSGILDERLKLLSEKTSYEACYLVLKTHPKILSKHGRKLAEQKRKEQSGKFGINLRPGLFGQTPYGAMALREQHEGFSSSVARRVGEVCKLQKLDAHEAVSVMRGMIAPEATPASWRPVMLGDKFKPRLVKESKSESDLSNQLPPKVGIQLFPTVPRVSDDDPSMVRCGSRTIAPLYVDLPAQFPMPFSELFKAVAEDIPWAISIKINTGHDAIVRKIKTKSSIATFLAFANSDNRLIKSAAEDLLAYGENGVLAATSMSVMTWGYTAEEALSRKYALAQSVSSWGSTEIADDQGDPTESWLDCIPGMTSGSVGTQFPLKLEDLFHQLPVSRLTSPWKEGTVMYRTVDAKPYLYMPGSSEQTSWFDLYYAPPGNGKSLSLANANLGFLLKPGNSILPRLAINDIGPSGTYFVQMIKEALPENKRHLAQAFKIRMAKEYYINPMDLPLGLSYPTPEHKEFLSNLFSLLLTPAGSDAPPLVAELSGKLIDSMYDYFSDDNAPKPYEEFRDPTVDTALSELNFNLEGEPTWREVVHFLFKNDRFREATLAQRFAVPTISDATAVLANTTTIKDLYGSQTAFGGPLLDFIESMFSSVVSDYPILSGPTVFDIGQARVCCMDLSEVARGGSVRADKMRGVMYMIARHAMCSTFYINEETVASYPTEYRDYHQGLLDQEAGCPAKICYDEYHRTDGCGPVRKQVKDDVREGRKFNVHTAVLSQLLSDFDDDLIQLADNKYILSKGNTEDNVKDIINRFSPSRDAIRALRLHVTAPTKEGKGLLFLGSVKGNQGVEAVVVLTMGPTEQWAYTTVDEDQRLRSALTNLAGASVAGSILAKRFPSASAKAELEELGLSDELVMEGEKNVFTMMAKNLYREHLQGQN